VRRRPGTNVEQPPARMLLECLRDREDDVLRFLSDLRIPPTSNQAERDVRPAKTQQKISGQPDGVGCPGVKPTRGLRHTLLRCSVRAWASSQMIIVRVYVCVVR
jgi:hypothetical protein